MSFFTASLGSSVGGFKFITGKTQSYDAIDPADAEIAWNIRGVGANKGYVQVAAYNVGDAASYSNSHQWAFPLAGWGTGYIRLTYEAGSDAVFSTSHAIDGATWHTVTEDSTNIFWTTRHTARLGDTTTKIKVEFSLNGGTTIITSGTYESICTVSV